MRLFSRGKSGGLMNVIRCDEEEYIVWKWRPEGQDVNSTSRENSIRYGSSLRVKDGEMAVFVYTQNPGLWLGKRAERLKEIEHRMNRNFNGDCLHDYKLYLVRDKDSSLMFFKHWFEQK